MSNVYLEKIASLTGAIGSTLRSVGRVGYKAVSNLGNQAHLAMGGGFRDVAARDLKITDPSKLVGIKNAKTLGRAFQKTLPPKSSNRFVRAETQKYLRPAVRGLQQQQTDARIILAGTAGGVGFGVNAIKNRTDNANQSQYQQQYQY